MKKFAKGGFPSNKEVFIQTDGELCGKLGGKALFPHEPQIIPEELQKAIAKSPSEHKGNIEVRANGKENL